MEFRIPDLPDLESHMQPRRLSEDCTVDGQISPADCAAIAAAGYKVLVNNRPEREQADQPNGEAIRAAAEAAGLRYVAIPIVPGDFSPEVIGAMRNALISANGPVYAFCRSGNRSATAWAMANAGVMDDAQLVRAYSEAGYDGNALAGWLERMR